MLFEAFILAEKNEGSFKKINTAFCCIGTHNVLLI